MIVSKYHVKKFIYRSIFAQMKQLVKEENTAPNEVVISGNEKVKGVLFEWGIIAHGSEYKICHKKEIPLDEVTMSHIEPFELFDTDCGFYLVIHAVVKDVLYLATARKDSGEKTLERISVDVDYEYSSKLPDGTLGCFYIKPILK